MTWGPKIFPAAAEGRARNGRARGLDGPMPPSLILPSPSLLEGAYELGLGQFPNIENCAQTSPLTMKLVIVTKYGFSS